MLPRLATIYPPPTTRTQDAAYIKTFLQHAITFHPLSTSERNNLTHTLSQPASKAAKAGVLYSEALIWYANDQLRHRLNTMIDEFVETDLTIQTFLDNIGELNKRLDHAPIEHYHQLIDNWKHTNNLF